MAQLKADCAPLLAAAGKLDKALLRIGLTGRAAVDARALVASNTAFIAVFHALTPQNRLFALNWGASRPGSVWLSEPQQDLVATRARDSYLPMNGTSVTLLTEAVMTSWNQASGTGSSNNSISSSSGG